MTLRSSIGFRAAVAILAASASLLPSPARAAPYTFVDVYALTPAPGHNRGSPALSATPIGAGAVVGGFGTVSGSGNPDRAVVWNAAGQPINVNGANDYSEILGVGGGQQVGYVGVNNTGHAAIWTGGPSFVDLNPTSGIVSTAAEGTDGVHQVGYGSVNSANHALLWTGTASSLVDLHPASGYVSTVALSVGGTQQVGFGYIPGPFSHALLWTGSASSLVDLNPSGYTRSSALYTNGSQQVGQSDSHAILWNGSATSAVDLGTGGYTNAAADFTNGTQQVGYGSSGPYSNIGHALLWNGTNQATDLGNLVPASFGYSAAYYIDPAGVIYGMTYNGTTGVSHLVEFIPTPEPSSLCLVATLTLTILSRRRTP